MSASKRSPSSTIPVRPFCRHAPSGSGSRSRALVRLASLAAALLCLSFDMAGAECIDYGDYLHRVGSVDTPGYAYGVAVSGTHAYVANDYFGLQVIDITNPTSPQIVGSVDTPVSALAVAVSGTHAYVADYTSGLQVIDITNPASPQIVGSVDTPGSAYGVAVSGTYAYVTDAYSGLHVLPTQCESESEVGEDPLIPVGISLRVCPNPASSPASARFVTTRSGLVQVGVFDVTGRCIHELFRGILSAGDHTLVWDGRADGGRTLSAGVYLMRVTTPDGVSTARYVVLR